MPKKYSAFISYRHLPTDTKVASKLHKMIERYVIPRDLRTSKGKQLGLVFQDKEELPLTSDLSSDIFEALDNSEFLIVVCTPETPNSKWVQREIEHFISVHGRNRVFVVLAEGTMQESVPEQIINVYAEDGTTVIDQIEPLVAVIADEKPARVMRHLRKEFLRLVAGMLGVSYDSLYQRNKRYQMRRIAVLMMLVIALGTAFIGTLFVKNKELSQKNEEIAQKNQQIHEQLLATQLSESYSMAQLSLQALEDGNRNEAIRTAMAVLPSDGNERPFCPDAQYALTQALHAYELEGVYPIGHIRQATQIEDIAVSANGRYAVTLDTLGMLRGFDLHTLQQIWEKESGTTHPTLTKIRCLEQDDLFLFTTSARNQFENGNLILSSDTDLSRCIDAATGDFLGKAAESYRPGPDGSIAVLQVEGSFRPRDNNSPWTNDFALYDTASGEILDVKALPEADAFMGATILSADYKRLLLVDVVYSTEMKTYHLEYQFYDLESCKLLNKAESSWKSDSSLTPEWMYSADGTMAIIRADDYSHFYTAIDLETGSVIWEHEFLLGDDSLNKSGMFPLEDGSTMLWAVDRGTGVTDMVYCRRIAADGTVIMQDSKECDEEDHVFTYAEPFAYDDNGIFHFFASGYETYVRINEGIYWISEAYYINGDDDGNHTTLADSYIYLDSYLESDTCTALLDTLNETGLYCAEDVSWGTGILCVVTQYMQNEIAVLQSVRNPYALVMDDDVYYEVFAHEVGDGFTTRRPIEKEGASFDCLNQYVTIKVPSMKAELSLGCDHWFLEDISPDGSKLFTGSQILDLASGIAAPLPISCIVNKEDTSNFQMLPRGYDTARNPTIYAMWSNSCQAPNGEKHLHLWIDDEEIQSPPLARQIGFMPYYFRIGAGGLVVFPDDPSFSDEVPQYIVYSIENQMWKAFPVLTMSRDIEKVPYEACETKKQFVYADYDGLLHLCDFDRAEEVKTLPLPTHVENIGFMQFVLEDQVLLILDVSKDTSHQYTLYAIDMNSGDVLFEHTFEGKLKLRPEEIFAHVDEATNSLYLCDAAGEITGLRIDVENWRLLAEIEGLVDVVASDEYVICKMDHHIVVYPAYSLEMLMAWGDELIN